MTVFFSLWTLLRSLLLYILLTPFCVFIYCTGILLPVSWRYHYILVYFCRGLLFLSRWICGIRYHVKGKEHIPTTPVIIMSNHQSTWETQCFPTFLPPMAIVLRSSLLRIPFYGWGLAQSNPIAIDRTSHKHAFKQMIQGGKQALSAGRNVLIYPEGTRAAPGEIAALSRGSCLIAKKLGAPILPIVHNAGHCWPKKSVRKYPGLVTIQVGPLIDTTELSADAIHATLSAWMKDHYPHSSD